MTTLLDTLQRLRNSLNDSKKSIDSQISLGNWSFSVDASDNFLIKVDNVVHTTISPNGTITTHSIVIPNGPVIAGNSVTGLLKSNACIESRIIAPNLKNTITIQPKTLHPPPFGFVTSMSNDGMWLATSNGIDGGYSYGSVIVNRVYPSISQEAILVSPSNSLDQTMFGISIHVNADGSLIYVGEPGIDKIHIFKKSNSGTWSLDNTIIGVINKSMFGMSIAVINDLTLVVGAPAAFSNAGALYVYERTSSSWVLKWTQRGADNIANYQLGTNVTISSDLNIIVASAVGSASIFPTSGTVEIYRKGLMSGWTSTTKLTSPVTPGSSTLFGGAIEISDDAKYIFIRDAEMPIGIASGYIYIYALSKEHCVLISTISAGRNLGARFGWAIKERNGILYVGSPGDNNCGANANAGYVTVFKKQYDKWHLSHCISPPSNLISTNAYFGWSIAAAAADLVSITMPFNEGGYLLYYEPDAYNTSGAITKTQTLLPNDADKYDIGSVKEPYANIYLQNSPTVISDFNKKRNIRDIERDITFINAIEPVTYTYRNINDGKQCIGFVAQQIAESAAGSNAVIEKDGCGLIKPHELISPLIKSCQQISNELDLLKTYIRT